MSAGPAFFQTVMGHKFYEADVPALIRKLDRIAAALEQLAEGRDTQEQAVLVAEFTTRDAAAALLRAEGWNDLAETVQRMPLPSAKAETGGEP